MNNVPNDENLTQPNSVSLYPEVVTDKSGNKIYGLLLMCVISDWLFIGDDESLILLIDGNEKIALKGKGSRDKRDVSSLSMGRSSYTYVTEKAYYTIEPELLRKIAHAGFIKVKSVGRSKYLVRNFNVQTLLNYRRFVDEYIDGTQKTQ